MMVGEVYGSSSVQKIIWLSNNYNQVIIVSSSDLIVKWKIVQYVSVCIQLC